MSADFSLGELLKEAIEVATGELRVSLPGRVERYDHTTQLADVIPMVRRRLRGDDGDELIEMPVITNVPIEFPGCGSWFISWPIAAGDTVRLTFADFNLDKWISHGGITDAADGRLHHLTDATAYPGLRAQPDRLTEAHASNMVLGKRGGPQIHVKDNEIHIGQETAPEFVALAAKVDSAISAIISAYNTHVHSASGGPTLATLSTIELQPSVAASKVKAV